MEFKTKLLHVHFTLDYLLLMHTMNLGYSLLGQSIEHGYLNINVSLYDMKDVTCLHITLFKVCISLDYSLDTEQIFHSHSWYRIKTGHNILHVAVMANQSLPQGPNGCMLECLLS